MGEISKSPDVDLQACEPVVQELLHIGVRFLIVGGWAVRFHCNKERIVEDLDLLVEFSAENWPRLQVALQHFHVLIKPFDELSQRSKWPIRIWELEPVDILAAIGSPMSESKSSSNSIEGFAVTSILHPDSNQRVSFDEAWAESIETNFG